MKRVISLILVLAAVLSLCACGDANGNATATAPGSGTAKALRPGETIQAENFELTVVGSKFFTHSPLAIEPPDVGSDINKEEAHCVVYLGIKNTGKEDLSIPSSVIKALTFGDGYEFPANGSDELNGGRWKSTSPAMTSATSKLGENLTTLTPLSDAKLLAITFIVPQTVMDNTDEAASVTLEIGGNTYSYDLRQETNLLSKEGFTETLAIEVVAHYQEVWLIRNITYHMELLYEDGSFIMMNIGNLKNSDNVAFSQEFMDRMKAAFDPVYEQIPADEVAKILPETTKSLENVNAVLQELQDLVNKINETHSKEYISPIQKKALDFLVAIDLAHSGEEITKYGQFCKLG